MTSWLKIFKLEFFQLKYTNLCNKTIRNWFFSIFQDLSPPLKVQTILMSSNQPSTPVQNFNSDQKYYSSHFHIPIFAIKPLRCFFLIFWDLRVLKGVNNSKQARTPVKNLNSTQRIVFSQIPNTNCCLQTPLTPNQC